MPTASLALDYVVVCLSGLTREEFQDAYYEIAVMMSAFLTSDKLNDLRRRAIEKRIELAQKFRETFEKDFLEDVEECLEDGLSEEGQELYDSMMDNEVSCKDEQSNAKLIDVAYSLEPLLKHYVDLSAEDQEKFKYNLDELLDTLKNP